MPETATAPGAIHIDRLVLEIPGLEASQVPALALEIGRRLAQVGIAGDRGSVSVTLDGGDAHVAQCIAAALRTEFSR